MSNITKDDLIKLVRSNVRDLVLNESYEKLLNMMVRLDNYSATNVILIMLQRPNSTFLLDESSWNNLGRVIKQDEINNGVKILLPDSKTESINVHVIDIYTGRDQGEEIQDIKTFFLAPKEVYDISQTTGQDLTIPKRIIDPVLHFEELIKTIIKISPVPLELDIAPDINDSEKYEILKNAILKLSQYKNYEFNENYERYDKDTVYFESESMSFIICQHLGLTYNPVFDYVTKWSKPRKVSYILEVLENIQRKASNIIFHINNALYS